MGLENSENDLIVDDGDGVTPVVDGEGVEGDGGSGNGSISCSICLEAVTDAGERSWCKLQCGHLFHLDCIGSAFNIKGVMQCPNCRKIEKGQWLFANNGPRSVPEINMEDWALDEDVYYSVSEVSLGVHYCPFGGGLARIPSSFEDGEFSLNAYHEQQAAFAEQAAAAITAAGVPYVYFGPVHPSSSSSSSSVSEASNFIGPWSPQSVDMPGSYGFPGMDLNYHGWEHQSPPFSITSSRIGGADQQPSLPPNAQRASRSIIGPQRAGSFMHPFLPNPSSGARTAAGSSLPPSSTPTYQGSNARARDRVQALQEYYQQQPQPRSAPSEYGPVISAARRQFNRHRASPPDPSSGFYFLPQATSPWSNYQEAANLSRTRFRAQDSSFPMNIQHTERGGDSVWEANGSSDAAGTRSGGLRQMIRGLERTSQQNRS
ncbi:E3 ubiquitin-protein ligase RFI2 [Linum perenne]